MKNIAIHIVQKLNREKTFDFRTVFTDEAALRCSRECALKFWKEQHDENDSVVKIFSHELERGKCCFKLGSKSSDDFEEWTIVSCEDNHDVKTAEDFMFAARDIVTEARRKHVKIPWEKLGDDFKKLAAAEPSEKLMKELFKLSAEFMGI